MNDKSFLSKYSDSFDRLQPLPEYPRPQLRRESYINLNGEWDFALCKGSKPEYTEKITVPYPAESALSGICRTHKNGEYLYYRKKFTVNAGFLNEYTFLHIGACDCICEVFCNGIPVCTHTGGYLPFTADITESVRAGENELIFRVLDDLNYSYPTGKQRKKRGGIWYTPVSGIWQTVWLESVACGYIKSLKITPDIDSPCVIIDVGTDSTEVRAEITDSGKTIASAVSGGHFEIKIDNPRLWSSENPFLYGLKLTSGADTVYSYFAMRKFTVSDGRFMLNNKPYFINGLLDQGYFPDGIYTPADYKAYEDDILQMKKLGFNTLRKHIKIEPMIYYHLCDKLGMLVLQDMVNVGKYSFFKDTLLPFSGFTKRVPYINVNNTQKKNFTEHSVDTLNHLYNCPCVVYYTIFNEGWGQFDGDGLYKILKALDPTRIYDSTSGWFNETLSDVQSHHIYFKPIKLQRNNTDKPVIVSEFGGYSYICKNHIFNTKKNFGYGRYKTPEEFENAFIKLYETEIAGNIQNGLAGAIYTQLSDVEDETNGILTYDREICKLNFEKISAVMKKLNK